MKLSTKFFIIFKAKRKAFIVSKGKEKRFVFADNLEHAKTKYPGQWEFKQVSPLTAFFKNW
jgi:hypothetical protein